ncbi:FGGY-family carbohydrate kinase [Thiolapillus sp.]
MPKSRLRFLQGLLEGIARVEKTAYARLQELGAPAPRRVFTSGGGAQNQVWMAMRQRFLGTPVLPANHSQAACGAARIALKTISRAQ